MRNAEGHPLRRAAARAARADHGRLRRRHGDDGRSGAPAESGFRTAVPPPTARSCSEILGDRVTIANPFDFHTYIWFDRPAMQRDVQRACCTAGYDAVGLHARLSAGAEGRRLGLHGRHRGIHRRRARHADARGTDRLAARNDFAGDRASSASQPVSCRCRASAKRSRLLSLAGAVGERWRSDRGSCSCAIPARAAAQRPAR